jgi:RimJ/RimL family protein N-acetyltransferase
MQGDARNAAVLALMRRLGFRHEGSIVEGDWFKGEWTTLECFALLRREWAAR